MNRALFIDIREEEVLTYLFERRGGSYEVEETRSSPLSAPYDLSFTDTPEMADAAYMSLPLSSLNFRMIDLPFSDRDKIREILPMELDGMVLGGAEKVIFDSIVVGTFDDKYQVLAAYIEKDNLKKIIEKVKSHGIDPVFITSIELRSVLKDFSPSKLFSPVAIDGDDRVSLAIEEMKTPTIDLRQGEFAYTRDIEKARRSLKVTAVLAILLMLVVTADILFKIVSVRHEIAVIKNDMRKKYRELFPAEKNIMNELHQLKSHLKELKDKEDVYVGVNPLALLMNLSRVERNGIVFNEITLGIENIILKGESPSLGDVQQIQDKLNPVFSDVAISDSKASASGKTLFTLTAKEKKP